MDADRPPWPSAIAHHFVRTTRLSRSISLQPPLVSREGPPYAFLRTLFPFALTVFFGYFLLWLPEKRKREEIKNMLDGLKENDRVITAGGIHGTVTNVRREQDMVTIRVDEATGTKIRVGRSAIAQVISDNKKDGAEGTSQT